MTASTAATVLRSNGRRNRILRPLYIALTAFAFSAAGVFIAVIAFVIVPLLALLGGDRDRRERRVQAVFHRATRAYLALLWAIGVIRVRGVGVERLREPGTLFVANHPTLLDALILMSFTPQLDCVVKQSYYESSLLGAASRAAGFLPSLAGPELVAVCVERIAAGRSVVLFPEGTRSPKGALGPFERGAAHIALRAGVDPVPVTIRCDPPNLYGGQAWSETPPGRFTVTVEVGEPLSLSAVELPPSRPRAARAITSLLRDHLERQISVVDA